MGHDRLKILFLGGGTRVSHLEYFSQYFEVLTTDTEALAPSRRIVEKSFLTSPFDTKAFTSELINLIRREKIDVVIPVSHYSLKALDACRYQVSRAGALPLISNSRAIAVAGDKQKTYDFFKKNHIPVPEKYNPQAPHFPLFIKPKDGAGTKLSFKVTDQKELEFFKDYVPKPFIQVFCQGQEYTIDVFSDLDSQVIYAVPRKRIEARDGEIVKGVTEKIPKLIEYAKIIAEKLKTIGPICIQCFKTDKHFLFTEVNCRFGGGVTLSMKAGADFAKFLFEILSGKKLKYYEGWQEGLYFSRAYRDFYFYETNLGAL